MAEESTVKSTLANHEKRIGDLEVDVDRHEAFIVGNGNVGAKADIAMLKIAVDDIKGEFDGVKKALWALTASIIGAVIIWLITVFIPANI